MLYIPQIREIIRFNPCIYKELNIIAKIRQKVSHTDPN